MPTLAQLPRSAGQWTIAVLVSAGLATALRAQEPAPAASKFLRLVLVYDQETQEPIQGAEVTDVVTKNHATTSATGHVALTPEFVKSSGAILEVKKLGYAPIQTDIIDPLLTSMLLVPMTRATVELAPVVTMAAVNRAGAVMQGFEERRNDKRLRGTFLTPEELRQWDGQELKNVLARKGMVAQSRGTTSIVNQHCQTRFFVNGIQADALTRMVSDFEAIEFYQSALFAPAEYQGSFTGNVCGILVAWTRGS